MQRGYKLVKILMEPKLVIKAVYLFAYRRLVPVSRSDRRMAVMVLVMFVYSSICRQIGFNSEPTFWASRLEMRVAGRCLCQLMVLL